ncbi:MAG TPA: hypothetical protein VM537_23690 [Anaerolineae bacterium]|nr:hypothetical protein [Anaerolineae bacterium]
MPTTLTTWATEDSTYLVIASFTDESESAVVPNSITWSLADKDGTTINARSAVAVAVPAASINILLSGDDLEAAGSEATSLLLTVNAVYDSDLGEDLPLIAQCWIPIHGLIP